jgi:hypothetical protein
MLKRIEPNPRRLYVFLHPTCEIAKIDKEERPHPTYVPA